MSNLLQVHNLPGSRRPKQNAVGRMEYEVSPETAPWLVTSSSGCIWVTEMRDSGVVWAAFRQKATPDVFFTEVVESLLVAGPHYQWGNVHPLTEDGIQAAIDHLSGYDLGDLEILTPPTPEKGQPNYGIQKLAIKFDLAVRPSSWVPSDCLIVVPKNREYVGIVTKLGSTSIVGIVHNVARGIAVVSKRVA